MGGAPLTRTLGEYSHDPISGVPEGPFSFETDIMLIAGGAASLLRGVYWCSVARVRGERKVGNRPRVTRHKNAFHTTVLETALCSCGLTI
jgi:hypothetical protein